MPWMKIDDSFESHPKVKSIPKGKRTKAIGLWTLAGSWCARHLTDGFLPSYMVGELGGTKAESSLLVSASLWHEVDDGFTFHDWTDHQPSRAKVEEEREAAKERMRAARERKKGASSGSVRANDSVSPPNGSGEVRPTPRSVTPTRPDPTRPDPLEKQVDSDEPTPPSRSLALVENRPDVDRICEHLADRIEANGSKRPAIGKGWLDAARLMLDRDGRTENEIHGAIDWCQADEFWRANVLSLPTLRTKYDQLRLSAQRVGRPSKQQETDDLFARAAERMGIIGGGL